ncbi:MAG: TIM barrel protein, partial [Coriobacteriia bacterium]|nr:TIM barrel protein [Coriobacteriia bacterium]
IEMCQTLCGSVIVTHIPELISENLGNWHQLKKSLDELEELCAGLGVRIAVENRRRDKFDGIAELFAEYSPDFVGLCYDTGHGNIGGKGLGHLDSYKERLISLHLHDNVGSRDKHQPVFAGTVDWEEFARIIAVSPYREFLTLETDIRHSGFEDEDMFLESAYRDGLRLMEMISEAALAAPTLTVPT